MTNFTKEQLDLINKIKKTFNLQVVWHYLEYLRIENELGHTPSIEELVSNAGETTYGSWCIAVGSLKEAGFIKTDKVEEAAIIVFNTCCVRENAEERLLGKLGEVKKYKDGNVRYMDGVPMPEKGTAYIFVTDTESAIEAIGIAALVPREDGEQE